MRRAEGSGITKLCMLSLRFICESFTCQSTLGRKGRLLSKWIESAREMLSPINWYPFFMLFFLLFIPLSHPRGLQGQRAAGSGCRQHFHWDTGLYLSPPSSVAHSMWTTWVFPVPSLPGTGTGRSRYPSASDIPHCTGTATAPDAGHPAQLLLCWAVPARTPCAPELTQPLCQHWNREPTAHQSWKAMFFCWEVMSGWKQDSGYRQWKKKMCFEKTLKTQNLESVKWVWSDFIEQENQRGLSLKQLLTLKLCC